MLLHRIGPARAVALIVILCVGCDGDPPLRPDGGQGDPAPTYYADVAPLIARECLSCHVEGGIAPFALDSYELVSETARAVVPAVMTGYMPPWMPDRSCQTFEHERGLTMEERDVFARWQAGGLLEGDPADQPPLPPAPPTLEATDVARMVEPYTPDAARPDDYRCFLLDHTFDADTFLVGSTVVPDQRSIVHHVLVYAVPPGLLAPIEEADTLDAGPGYTCFGGPVPTAGAEGGSLGLVGLGAWVPGMVPAIAREGEATFVPAGSRVVMQIHYNLLSEEPRPDMTEFQMELTDEEPTTVIETFPLAIQDLDIAAGDAESAHRRVFKNYRSEPLRLTGFTPHMHLLGTDIRAHRIPADGGDASCLVDVPEWDFSWQQGYRLRAEDTVVLAPGEGIELECVYDNSDANQPVVNGVRGEPRDVTWGEGTLDEMCLMYVRHERPWEGPPPADGCAPAAACLAGCATDDTQCLLDCEGMGTTCRICAMESTLGCARATCLASYAPAAGCFDTCILSVALVGGSFDACMEAECPTGTWAPARDCVAGVVEAGTCDTMLAGCGITR